MSFNIVARVGQTGGATALNLKDRVEVVECVKSSANGPGGTKRLLFLSSDRENLTAHHAPADHQKFWRKAAKTNKHIEKQKRTCIMS
jgi:hypothetical protein